MNDDGKQEHINKILRIVTKVSYSDGSWIGAGFIDDPEFKETDIGIRVTDKFGKQILGFEMNMQNLLILVQVITIIVRMKIEQKITGLLIPKN